MKKILSVFAVMAMLFMGLAACSPKSRLELIAKEANKMCPIPVEGVGTTEKIEFNGTDIVYWLVVDDDEVDIDVLARNEQETKEFMLQEFVSPSADIKEMIDALKPAGAGITYVYSSKLTGKQVTIHLSIEEIEAVYNNPSALVSPEKNLEMQVAIANRECPQAIEEGMVATRVFLDEDYVVYEYEMDEEIYDMDIMESNRSEMMESLRDTEGDAEVIEFQSDCKKAGKGLSYRYVGNTSGKMVRFDIPASEL